MGQVVAKELAEVEPAQEVLQDGESGDPPRVEGAFASPGTCRLAGKSWSSRFVHAGRFRGFCRSLFGVRR